MGSCDLNWQKPDWQKIKFNHYNFVKVHREYTEKCDSKEQLEFGVIYHRNRSRGRGGDYGKTKDFLIKEGNRRKDTYGETNDFLER